MPVGFWCPQHLHGFPSREHRPLVRTNRPSHQVGPPRAKEHESTLFCPNVREHVFLMLGFNSSCFQSLTTGIRSFFSRNATAAWFSGEKSPCAVTKLAKHRLEDASGRPVGLHVYSTMFRFLDPCFRFLTSITSLAHFEFSQVQVRRCMPAVSVHAACGVCSANMRFSHSQLRVDFCQPALLLFQAGACVNRRMHSWHSAGCHFRQEKRRGGGGGAFERRD